METLEYSPKTAAISRRSFLLALTAGGAGAAFSVLPGSDSVFAALIPPETAASFEPTAWVRIDPDGTTTITVAKSDMGQGVRTSLAMIVAEEMDADWSKVKIRQARPDTGNGSLSTAGSSSVSGSYGNLRRQGATVRAMMISAAAKTWGIAEANCTAANGVVSERNGSRTLSYGELTDAAAAIPVPGSPQQKNPANFTLIGKPKQRVDNRDVVTGKAMYGLDVRIPGMKYAVIALAPTYSATLRTFDASEALKIPGVIKAERVNGINGVVVVAENTYAALRGRDALKIEWTFGGNATIDSATISSRLKAGIGTTADVPANSAIKIQAEYELPYLAHATMEPINCVADVRTGSAEVWCGTQNPDGVLSAVAQATGLPSSSIRVNNMLLGGGFGRRIGNDYASYAARISAAFKMPVLFMFTRADDMKNDGYRPASYHVLKGGLTADGQITGWVQRFVPGQMGEDPPYQIPSPSTSNGTLSSPVPVAAWRSVGHTAGVFVNECFIDELAHAAGKDPYQFRRNLLPAGRMRDALDRVAELSEWTKPLPAGWGRGMAICDAYSYVAHVVEVSVLNNILKVKRVVAVVDCGIAVNPLGVKAQMEGACVDALSTALKAAITIEKGAVKQSSFSDYEWLRMHETPKIEVHIIPSTRSPQGMGEAGYPSVSPALCNAIFDATGRRIRKLPVGASFFTGVEEQPRQGGELRVSPNPFSTSFAAEGRFDSPGRGDVQLTVRNLLGSVMAQTSVPAEADGGFSARLEFPPAADAMYLLTAEQAGRTMTASVVKM